MRLVNRSRGGGQDASRTDFTTDAFTAITELSCWRPTIRACCRCSPAPAPRPAPTSSARTLPRRATVSPSTPSCCNAPSTMPTTSAAAPHVSPKSIERLLRGEVRLSALMAKKHGANSVINAFTVEPEVIIDNVISDHFTVIEVSGLDRPGLLYGVTTAISDLNLDITSAHITTFGERAVDTFLRDRSDAQEGHFAPAPGRDPQASHRRPRRPRRMNSSCRGPPRHGASFSPICPVLGYRSSPMKLYSAFATVGGLTMASRILGFVRDILIAAVLGTGAVADAFFVAFRLPNLFRRLFAEGAFNSAFVPLFAKRLEAEGEASARQFAEEALAGLFAVLLVVTASRNRDAVADPRPRAGFLVGSGEVRPRDVADAASPSPISCACRWWRCSRACSTARPLIAAAAAPIVLNVVLIAVLLIGHTAASHSDAAAGHLLAWGVTVGRHRPTGMLCSPPAAPGLRCACARPRMTDGVRRLIALGIPGVHRRRHHPDQHRRRHDHRLARGRRRLLPLLCRPPLPAPARHRRHRDRRRPAPGPLARPRAPATGRRRWTARTGAWNSPCC